MAADLKLHAAVSHKKSAVVVSKLEDLSDSEEDIEFATSFLRARKKITKLLSMVKVRVPKSFGPSRTDAWVP